MKNQKLVLFTVLLTIPLLFAACKKENNDKPANLTSDITGTYKGSITPSNNLDNSKDAIIDISRIDEYTVHLAMVSEHIDTSFRLNVYDNADSIMVCFTGDRFNNEYGHHLDEDHHMMGDNNQMDWDHHMNEQHEAGDAHYGGFDMKHHHFSYTLVPGYQDEMHYQIEVEKEQ